MALFQRLLNLTTLAPSVQTGPGVYFIHSAALPGAPACIWAGFNTDKYSMYIPVLLLLPAYVLSGILSLLFS